MAGQRAEQMGSIFLAVFSSGLAAQLALDGMAPAQWLGASLAVMGSLALAWTVRAWPRPAEARSRRQT